MTKIKGWKKVRTSGVGTKTLLWKNENNYMTFVQVGYFSYIKKWRSFASKQAKNGRDYIRHEKFFNTLKQAEEDAIKFMRDNPSG